MRPQDMSKLPSNFVCMKLLISPDTLHLEYSSEERKSGGSLLMDAPDPGPVEADAPEADGGVNNLDGHEMADAGATEQATLCGQADQAAGDGSQEQPGCTRHTCSLSVFRENISLKSVSFKYYLMVNNADLLAGEEPVDQAWKLQPETCL